MLRQGGGGIYDSKIAYLQTGQELLNAISTGYQVNNTDTFVLELDIDLKMSSGYQGSNGNLQMNMGEVTTGRHTVRVERIPDKGPMLYVDGTLVRTDYFTQYNFYYICIFALGNHPDDESSVGHYVKQSVYSAWLTINGVLVRDYIPVRVGQVGYLYDKVSDALSGDLHGRAFTLGPDIV